MNDSDVTIVSLIDSMGSTGRIEQAVAVREAEGILREQPHQLELYYGSPLLTGERLQQILLGLTENQTWQTATFTIRGFGNLLQAINRKLPNAEDKFAAYQFIINLAHEHQHIICMRMGLNALVNFLQRHHSEIVQLSTEYLHQLWQINNYEDNSEITTSKVPLYRENINYRIFNLAKQTGYLFSDIEALVDMPDDWVREMLGLTPASK